LGSQVACLATYGLYTLLLFILNCYGLENTNDGIQFVLKNEVEVFWKFFEVLGDFDWDKYILTIYGPIRITNFYERLRDECNFDISLLVLKERMIYFGYKNEVESKSYLLFTPEEIDPLISKYAAIKLLSHC